MNNSYWIIGVVASIFIVIIQISWNMKTQRSLNESEKDLYKSVNSKFLIGLSAVIFVVFMFQLDTGYGVILGTILLAISIFESGWNILRLKVMNINDAAKKKFISAEPLTVLFAIALVGSMLMFEK